MPRKENPAIAIAVTLLCEICEDTIFRVKSTMEIKVNGKERGCKS